MFQIFYDNIGNWGKDQSACTVAIFGETISQSNYSTKVNGIVSLAPPLPHSTVISTIHNGSLNPHVSLSFSIQLMFDQLFCKK